MSQTQITLIKLLSGILPNLTIASKLAAKGLSRDPQVVEAYKADPLVHDKASIALGKFMYEGALYIMKNASEWNLPLYMAHGSEDPICPISGTKEFFSKLRGDVTLKVWEGLFHEIHNEPEKEQVLATMFDWVEARI
jgi:alpha-beta hydrolase superfamily lysophospholipase